MKSSPKSGLSTGSGHVPEVEAIVLLPEPESSGSGVDPSIIKTRPEDFLERETRERVKIVIDAYRIAITHRVEGLV
jgi:hypothetical protein